MQICILSRSAALYSTRRLIESGMSRGHQMVVADPLRCFVKVETGRSGVYAAGRELSDCRVVIPRIGASVTEYGLAIISQFEMLGVPVLNGATATASARDKLRCLQLLAHHGLPVPTSFLGRDRKQVSNFLDQIGGPPVVLKLLTGTQGIGVMLAETEESVHSILEAMWGTGRNVLIQQFVAEARGRDMRLLVIGDEVVAAMRRYAKGGEFRANLHRGGAGMRARPTPQARSLAIEATQLLGLSVAGVDLIETRRGPLILEVNASPGFEGLEAATSVDVAGRIIDFAIRVGVAAESRERSA